MHNYKRALPAAFLLAACVPSAAFAAPPAGFAGTISADYSNTNFSSGGGSADQWGINGAGAFGLGMTDFGAQIDASYHRTSASGVDANVWGIGGSIFWAPTNMWRIGPNVNYQAINFTGAGSGLDVHATSYGVFGEYFASDVFTIGVKGGGADGTVSISGVGSGSASGGYVGGQLTGYVLPNLAIKGSIDYVDVDGAKITSYGIGFEYLISEDNPISIFGGYNYVDISGASGHGNNWLVGLKFYTDGPASLVTHHRTGTLGSIASSSGLQFAF